MAGEQGRNLLPGPPCLPAAVRENDRHPIERAFDSGGDRVAAVASQPDCIIFHEVFLR